MKIKIFFFILLLASSTVTAYFGVKIFFLTFDYLQKKESREAFPENWEIRKINESTYTVCVKYWFTCQDIRYTGAYVFPEKYLNLHAALIGLNQKKLHNHRCWYNPHHPEDSSLIRELPFKLIIQFCIALLITIYFLFKKRLVYSSSVE